MEMHFNGISWMSFLRGVLLPLHLQLHSRIMQEILIHGNMIGFGAFEVGLSSITESTQIPRNRSCHILTLFSFYLKFVSIFSRVDKTSFVLFLIQFGHLKRTKWKQNYLRELQFQRESTFRESTCSRDINVI